MVNVFTSCQGDVSHFHASLHRIGDRRYDLLLVEIFSDPSRSGPLYLDGDR